MRHTVKCVCVLFCYIIIKSHKLYFWNGWKVVQTPLSELCCHQTHVAETAFHFHLQGQEQSVTIWPRGMRSPEAFDITRWWTQNTWSSRKAGRKVDLEQVLSTYQNVQRFFRKRLCACALAEHLNQSITKKCWEQFGVGHERFKCLINHFSHLETLKPRQLMLLHKL